MQMMTMEQKDRTADLDFLPYRKEEKKSKQKFFKCFLDFLRLLAKCIINWYRFLVLYIEWQLLKFMISQVEFI